MNERKRKVKEKKTKVKNVIVAYFVSVAGVTI